MRIDCVKKYCLEGTARKEHLEQARKKPSKAPEHLPELKKEDSAVILKLKREIPRSHQVPGYPPCEKPNMPEVKGKAEVDGAVDSADSNILPEKLPKIKKLIPHKEEEEFNPDFNGDGALNIMDFLAFQNAFAAGEKRADVNRDGSLGVKDFYAYRDVFKKYYGDKS